MKHHLLFDRWHIKVYIFKQNEQRSTLSWVHTLLVYVETHLLKMATTEWYRNVIFLIHLQFDYIKTNKTVIYFYTIQSIVKSEIMGIMLKSHF